MPAAGERLRVDPYVSTIIRQAAAWGLAVGIIAGLAYFACQYPKLQYALTLNRTPPQVP